MVESVRLAHEDGGSLWGCNAVAESSLETDLFRALNIFISSWWTGQVLPHVALWLWVELGQTFMRYLWQTCLP